MSVIAPVIDVIKETIKAGLVSIDILETSKDAGATSNYLILNTIYEEVKGIKEGVV